MTNRAFLIAGLALVMAGHAKAKQLLIMPLGDSITVGQVIGQPGVVTYEPKGGYRYLLEQILTESKKNFKFVGSYTINPHPNQRHPMHNAYTGMAMGPVPNYTNTIWNNFDFMVPKFGGYQPDIILFMLGMNDSNQGLISSQINANFTACLTELFDRRPNATILVGTVPGSSRTSGWIGFNEALRAEFGLLRPFKLLGKNVQLVDIAAKNVYPNHMWDYIHPNAEGQAIIARTWADALLRIWPKQEVTKPQSAQKLKVLADLPQVP